ncbi:uncharacterized protein LOC117115391 [Anneissia japonica]|uniref:uncharacterized protein LOC117115391 n=1 Tax=Anneissia japonica TaxID=1529436 RepID=UPI0014256B01|nr:uncharacterized protein LOC117115391 [Anneissia japonica]
MASRNTLDEDTKNYLRIFPIVLVEGAKALKYFLRKCLNDENDFKTFLDEFFFKVIEKLTKESEKSDPIENNRAKRDSSWSMIPTALERRDKCKYDASSLASILITSHIYADDLQHFKKFEDKFVDTITELRRICNRICHNFEETMSSTEFKSIVDEVKHHVTCLGYGTEGITAWEEKQLIDSENAEYIKDLIYAFSVTSIPEYSSAKLQSGSTSFNSTHDVFCQERKDVESSQKANSMIESKAANETESLHGARPKKAIEKVYIKHNTYRTNKYNL